MELKIKQLFSFLLLLSLAFSTSTTLEDALRDLCNALYDYVGTVAFIMILLSSIVFALGQMFGAETRARANVWATSMLTGAITGIILIVLVPSFLAWLLGFSSFDPNTCTFTGGSGP